MAKTTAKPSLRTIARRVWGHTERTRNGASEMAGMWNGQAIQMGLARTTGFAKTRGGLKTSPQTPEISTTLFRHRTSAWGPAAAASNTNSFAGKDFLSGNFFVLNFRGNLLVFFPHGFPKRGK